MKPVLLLPTSDLRIDCHVNHQARRRITVWAFHDDRSGHRNQIRGLLQGLSERFSLETIAISVSRGSQSQGFERWSVRGAHQWPAPDLLVGAGTATQAPILLARLLFGGRSVILMRPSWPCSFFDMVVAPEHDRVLSMANVVFVRGVVGPYAQLGERLTNRGLILLGGQSRHFRWTLEDIATHVDCILKANPEIRWEACDSRRTPETALNLIHSRFGIPVHRHQQQSATFLSEELAKTSHVWVTADSVSMLHEAVGAGARVGVLMLPCLEIRSKLLRGIDALARRKLVALSDDGYSLERVRVLRGDRYEPPSAAQRIERGLL